MDGSKAKYGPGFVSSSWRSTSTQQCKTTLANFLHITCLFPSCRAGRCRAGKGLLWTPAVDEKGCSCGDAGLEAANHLATRWQQRSNYDCCTSPTPPTPSLNGGVGGQGGPLKSLRVSPGRIEVTRTHFSAPGGQCSISVLPCMTIFRHVDGVTQELCQDFPCMFIHFRANSG